MTRIVDDAAERVGKDAGRLFECNPVFGVILRRLLGVPFEGRGHAGI